MRNVRGDIHRRSKKRRLKKWSRRTLISLSVFLAVLGFSAGIFDLDAVGIENIEVEGNSVLSSRDIKNFVSSQIAGSYFSLYPKKSTFIYPDDSIKSNTLKNFKRIKSVDLKRIGFEGLSVNVKEREPYALWCRRYQSEKDRGENSRRNRKEADDREKRDAEQEKDDSKKKDKEEEKEEGDKDLSSKEECYFIDNSGFIFAEAPHFTERVYFRYYTNKPLSAGNVSSSFVGKNALDKEDFERVERFLDTLSNLQMEPVEFSHIGGSDYGVVLNSDVMLKITLDKDLVEMINHLRSALQSQVFDGEKTFENLKYLDLRFDNKIFYKF